MLRTFFGYDLVTLVCCVAFPEAQFWGLRFLYIFIKNLCDVTKNSEYLFISLTWKFFYVTKSPSDVCFCGLMLTV
jgi:hypothetical protein